MNGSIMAAFGRMLSYETSVTAGSSYPDCHLGYWCQVGLPRSFAVVGTAGPSGAGHADMRSAEHAHEYRFLAGIPRR